MSAIDEFDGAAVASPADRTWPLNRATLRISNEAISCTRSSGRCDVRQASDGSPVTITRYKYFPICVRTIVWVDQESRAGFSARRWREVSDSLRRHQWQVTVQTKSWLTIASDFRAGWRWFFDRGELPTT